MIKNMNQKYNIIFYHKRYIYKIMVLKLAGKIFLFGILWWSCIDIYKNPENYLQSFYFLIFLTTDLTKFVQILSICYFILISLGFLEVRWAIWMIILKLCYSMYNDYSNNLALINNIVLISGLLIFYNKITRMKPLVITKKT